MWKWRTEKAKRPVIVCTGLSSGYIVGYSINDRMVPFNYNNYATLPPHFLCACRFWKSVTIG